MKKVVSLALCVVLAGAALAGCTSKRYDPNEGKTNVNKLPVTNIELESYEIPEEEKIYTVDVDYNSIENALKITGYTGEVEDLEIPATLTHKDYGVLPVVSIGESAFLGCETIKSVVIPEGVTTISKGAFQNCSKLTDVYLPETITTIGENAFNNSALMNIKIPASVTSIGKYAFSSILNETPWYAAQKAEKVIVGDGILLKYNGARSGEFGDEVKHVAYYAFREPGAIMATFGNALETVDKLAVYETDGNYEILFRVPEENAAGVAAIEDTQYTYEVIPAAQPVQEPQE